MSLTTLRHHSREDLEALLGLADTYADGAGDDLKGRLVSLAFFEPSTRTRLSFELAAARQGAGLLVHHPATSSETKGESLRDTALTLAALGVDLFVVRHRGAGAPALIERWTGVPVVSAGDGAREHPTQTLADALTLRRHFGALDGLHIGIVGDVAHSRVARGHLWAFPRLGARVTLIGPPTLLPSPNPWGVELESSLDAVIPDLDVVYLLRLQTERGAGRVVPGLSAYASRCGLDSARHALLRPEAVIMHAGPVNRGVELSLVEDDLISAQVSNGVPARMAAMRYALEGGRR